MSKQERVAIWNSFFELARKATSAVGGPELGTDRRRKPDGGGHLSEQDEAIIGALALCVLAIEARANHMLAELLENHAITEDVYNAGLYLPVEHRWFLLPKIAGKARSLDGGKAPHQSIATICKHRNNIMHVRYEALSKSLQKLPKPRTMVQLFNGFVDALDDMNSILRGTPLDGFASVKLKVPR